MLAGREKVQPHDGIQACGLKHEKAAERLKLKNVRRAYEGDGRREGGGGGEGVRARAEYLKQLKERVLPRMAHKPAGTADALVAPCLQHLTHRLLRFDSCWYHEAVLDIISSKTLKSTIAAVFMNKAEQQVDAAANHGKGIVVQCLERRHFEPIANGKFALKMDAPLCARQREKQWCAGGKVSAVPPRAP